MTETQKTSPRDVFLYLLSIVALGISAISFGTLLFQYTNIYFPDPLTDQYRPVFSYYQPIRWAVASLVVVFPVYVWVSWFLQKDVTAYPEKRELKIRKWLLYLTLFLAAIIIIVDLITLIFNYLQGELTLRFVLKILSVLFIAATTFAYYLWNLKKEEMAIKNPKMRIFVGAMIVIVAVATIFGFVVAGSPTAERSRRFDERRVNDLQMIQNEIINYWQRKDKLPQNLDELKSDISGFAAPSDPQTGTPYEYRAAGALKFELCATFETASQGNQSFGQKSIPAPVDRSFYPGMLDSWQHGLGRVCFEREIDPTLYPKPEKPPR